MVYECIFSACFKTICICDNGAKGFLIKSNSAVIMLIMPKAGWYTSGLDAPAFIIFSCCILCKILTVQKAAPCV